MVTTFLATYPYVSELKIIDLVSILFSFIFLSFSLAFLFEKVQDKEDKV